MKSATIIAITAGSAAAVLAADSPYIPSGISSKCTTYLTSLDTNAALATCSSALLSATALFDPASSSARSATDAQIKSSLSSLCKAQCDSSVVQAALTSFSSECADELAAGNAVVKSNYDVLYLLSPFTSAVCTKDDSGNYCALEIGNVPASSSSSSSASSTGSGSQQLLVQTSSYQIPRISLSDLYVSVADAASAAVSRFRKRQAVSSSVSSSSSKPATSASASASSGSSSPSTVTSSNAVTPNATTFRSAGLPFLLINANMTSAQLCTSCTKSILAAYVSFETQFPYASGLSSSPMLKDQITLWNSVGGVCGSGFLSTITNQAGGAVNAAGKIAVGGKQAVVALGAAVLALAMAL
ncbi:hypothetical protein EMMF5_001911 [Cystobasidiomycetes sp. EMM_F5]